MTIPYIPAIDPSVGQNLQTLIQLAGRTLKPYAEVEHALQQAFQSNPQALQQYADFAASNPDVIRNLVGPRASGYLASVPESPASRLARTQAGYQQSIVGGRSDALNAMPPQARANAGRAGAVGDLAGMSESQVAGEARKLETGQAFETYRRAFPQFNPLQFVRNFRTGAKDASGAPLVPFDVMTGALQSPDAPSIQLLLNKEEADADAALRRSLARENDASNRANLIFGNQVDSAQRLYIESRGAGTEDAWRTWGTSPIAHQRALQLAQSTPEQYEALNDEDKALADVAKAAGQMQGERRAKITGPASNRMRIYLSEVTRLNIARKTKKIEREEYETAINNLANALNSDLSILDTGVTAEVEQITDNDFYADRDGIVLKRADGAVVPINELNRIGVTNSNPPSNAPPRNNTGLSGNAQYILDAIRTNPSLAPTLDSMTGLTPVEKRQVRAALLNTPQR